MHFKDLNRGELIAVIGGVVLAISLFLTWYDLGDQFTTLGSCKGPHSSCTGWNGLPALRFILLAVAVAPLILAYIVVRGHALSWPRGELTAITALIALVSTLFVGILDKPGQPRGQISLSYGWFIGLLGGLLILLGAVWRTQESGAQRKPPGVL